MELKKLDGLGQGKVSSTALWNVGAKYALRNVRRDMKDIGIDCAFIDDLTQLLEVQHAVTTYDATQAAMVAAGALPNMKKVTVFLPLATNDNQRENNRRLRRDFLARGVLPANILTEHDEAVEQQGFELLGVPHGSDAFKSQFMAELAAKVESDGEKVSSLALNSPAEAVALLVMSLSKRLGFAARQCTPTSNAVKALATAHKHSLAVVAHICGSNKFEPATGEISEDADTHPLPPFAAEVCGLARRHGGLALQPLDGLAKAGVLHLAVLAGALPKLLARLRMPDSGQASDALADEIEDAENSHLPWAAEARDAYASVKAMLAPLSPADAKLLKELAPGDKKAGTAVVLPSLQELVTTGSGLKKFQMQMSHAFSERDLLRLYKTYVDEKHRFMLRTGSAEGATGFLQPATTGLGDDYCAASGRMKPHIFRMALRGFLCMEHIPGLFAMLVAEKCCCPSCGRALHTEGLDEWVVAQHLIACCRGGWWNRIAKCVTWAVSESYKDVGVQGKTEVMGLSEISSHRPGDFVSDAMNTPMFEDAGGYEKHAVDTTVSYTTATAVTDGQTGHQQKTVNQAERNKVSKLKREVAQGKRTGLPKGYRFVPVGISSRGVMGEGMEKLFGWLADYGAKNRGVLTYLDDEAAKVKTMLVRRWTQRMSVAVNRATMEALWFRALDIQAAVREKRGGRGALTGIDLRFGGGMGG